VYGWTLRLPYPYYKYLDNNKVIFKQYGKPEKKNPPGPAGGFFTALRR
jgi:hypothetical protein